MTMTARLFAIVALGLALTACSRGSNEIVVSPDIAPADVSTHASAHAPADPSVDRPEEPAVRPADLDANAVAIAPDAPPPPAPELAAGTPAPPTLKQLIGDVSPASDPDFAAVPASLGPKGGLYANREALAAFVRMQAAARRDGVDLVILSAFRSFNDQKRIWNNKWTGKTLVEGGKLPRTVPDPMARAEKILEFSSMPGTSRHHWGTDFDLNDLTNGYFAQGKGKAIHDWLSAHASEYGFCQVYSPKGPDRPRGYNREDWHWSYLPVASRYLAAYPRTVGYEKLAGFEGASTAKAIDVIPNYVQGINPACMR